MPQRDQYITERYNQKDLDAFDVLYHTYYQAVFANIYKLIRQQQVAEDILQEVFIALWENRKKIRTEQSASGWLFVVSYNKSVTYLKKAVREKMLGTEALHIKDEITDNSLFEYQLTLVNTAIGQLSPKKKMAFTLCKLEGKTQEEAARLLGISPLTIKEYLKAASKHIKAYALDKYAADTTLSAYLLLIFLQSL